MPHAQPHNQDPSPALSFVLIGRDKSLLLIIRDLNLALAAFLLLALFLLPDQVIYAALAALQAALTVGFAR